MTDAEIIKALECCGIHETNCTSCPYFEKTYCVDADALKLINRQKAEIEELYKSLDKYILEIHSQKAEIERLQKFCDIYSTEGERAVKQFVAWFKKRAMATRKDNDGNCRYEVDDKFIDNLVKEMTEGDK